MSQEPKRPETVPAEAKWNGSENEWELGKRNKFRREVGEWKWWQAPEGYLCCHTFYEGDGGDTFSFTRFHPDGTPSRKGRYVNGQPAGQITWIRSDKPTIENYPENAGENVWTTVSTIKHGFTVEEHYFDKNNREIQEPYIADREPDENEKHAETLIRFLVDKNWRRALEEADLMLENEFYDGNEGLVLALYAKLVSRFFLNGEIIDKEMEGLAERISKAHTFSLWAYLKESRPVIMGLRFACYIKARAALDNKNEGDASEYVQRIYGEFVYPDFDEMEKRLYEPLKYLAGDEDI
jgi:hypothetical protein